MTPWMRLLSGASSGIPVQHVDGGLLGRKGQHWGHFGLGVSIIQCPYLELIQNPTLSSLRPDTPIAEMLSLPIGKKSETWALCLLRCHSFLELCVATAQLSALRCHRPGEHVAVTSALSETQR